MDLEDEIARVAYELYERDGRLHGKDQEHWLEAERIVKERHQKRDESGEGRTAKTSQPKLEKAVKGRGQKKEQKAPGPRAKASTGKTGKAVGSRKPRSK